MLMMAKNICERNDVTVRPVIDPAERDALSGVLGGRCP